MVEASEQRGSLGRDDGCFEVGACEVADGFKGAPVGFDDDFDFACEAKKRNRGTEVARDAAKFGQNILGKVFEVFGQLRFSGARGPAAQNRSSCES